MKNFGKELILDLHKCNPDTFTRKYIKRYFERLCAVIDMKRETLYWWDFKGYPKEYAKAPAHLKGISAIQFIQTSNITLHTLDDLGQLYINVFSCKDFNAMVVRKLTEGWFEGITMQMRVIERI